VGRDFISEEIAWASGEPKTSGGDCVTVRFGKNLTDSDFATADCSEQKNFVCEVINYENILIMCLKRLR